VTNLVRSELLKIRTTRGWYAYLAVIVLLTGLAVAGDVGSAEQLRRNDPAFQVGLVESAGIASLLAIILGITVVTTEFRHGTITPTLLANPKRELVVAGKGISTTIVSVLFALLALIVVVVMASIWLSVVGADIHFGDRDVLVRAAESVLIAVLWGLMGVAVGTLVQSQVAALVGTLVWVFLVETLLVGIFSLLDIDRLNRYLPFRALDAADGSGGPELLSYWPAVGVSAAWIAVIGAAGLARLLSRDIT
jgi:ABC-2 type transport system permease protein